VLLGLLAACTSPAKPNANMKSDQDFATLLQKLEKDKSTSEAEIKALERSTPTEGASSVEPLTKAEKAAIRVQVEKNWDLRSLSGAPGLENILVLIRVALKPDGTVTNAEIINEHNGSYSRAASESCLRAVRMSSPLKLPPGKTYTSMVLRFRPSEVSF
jgi:hypothetical protein